eukprot:1079713-Rhodomonas_salina.1
MCIRDSPSPEWAWEGSEGKGGGRREASGFAFWQSGTPQNQAQETAFSVQFVPGMRFLVFEFAVWDHWRESVGAEGSFRRAILGGVGERELNCFRRAVD